MEGRGGETDGGERKGEKACGLICNRLQLHVNGSLLGCRSGNRRNDFVDL